MNKGYIVIQNGPLEGKEFEIARKLTVGRTSNNTIRLSDDLVSRAHAEIIGQGQTFVVRDLKSRNGTKVNGVPITEKVLNNGDLITIGDTGLKFSLAPPKAFVVIFEKDTAADSVAEVSPGLETIFTDTSDQGDIRALKDKARDFQRLYETNKIIAGEVKLARVLDLILDRLIEIFPADRVLIMLTEEGAADMVPKAIRPRNSKIDISEVRISHTILNRVVREAVGLVTSDAARDERLRSSQSILAEEIHSAMCVPLLAQEAVVGIIYMDTKGQRSAFSEMDLRLLTGIAGPAAIAIQNARYREKVEFFADEIRNPLTSALLNLDALMSGSAGKLNEEQSEAIDSIRRDVSHFEEMIKNYFKFQRAEKSDPPIKKTLADLR